MSRQVFGTGHVPLSPAVRAGDLVFFVGGRVPEIDCRIVPGGIGPETRAVLESVKKRLGLAAATMSDVVKTTVWLRDRTDFAAFDAGHAGSFPHQPPARFAAESRLMIGIAAEIEAIAYAPRCAGPPQTLTGSPSIRALSCKATKRE